MKLFILDYNGTLSTTPDPVAFVEALKARHPKSQVVLYTGQPPDAFPLALRSVLDGIWTKPCFLPEKVDLLGNFHQVTIVDDDPWVLRATLRTFRVGKLGTEVICLEAGQIMTLLSE